jgi:hypothetical protein
MRTFAQKHKSTSKVLTKDTPLGRTAKVDPKGTTWWASVIVTGGPNVGMTGWVKEVDLY